MIARPRRTTLLVWAALVGLFVLPLVLSTYWVRPLLQHVVMERSGRAFDASAIHFGLTADLLPTILFRDLRIENAPWAGRRPFVEAGELRFTFAWRSLTESKWIVMRLGMADAAIDMEYQADGLRNWRLTNPDDRGPGRVRVLAVDAVRSRVHVVHGGAGVTADLAMLALPTEERVELPQARGLPLTKRFQAEGRRHGVPFSANAKVSDVLTFIGTDASFGAQGTLRTAGADIGFAGLISDLAHVEACDLDVTFAAHDLSTLRSVLPNMRLPALAAQGSATVHRGTDRWSVERLQARVGHSDVAGDIAYVKGDGERRPMARVTLASKLLHWNELTSWPAANGPKAEKLADWQDADADVDLRIEQVDQPALPMKAIQVAARLRNGVVDVSAFQVGVAGGRLSGSLTADMVAVPPRLSAKLDASALNVDGLSRSVVSGAVKGHAAIAARGDTLAALADTLSGRVALSLSGGSMPKALDAKLALDGPAIVAAMLSAEGARVPIQCAQAVFQIDRGHGQARELVFETERSVVSASGSVSVAQRTVDLLITPHVRQRSLLSLRRSIRVVGPLAAPRVSLADAEGPAQGEGCAPGSGGARQPS